MNGSEYTLCLFHETEKAFFVGREPIDRETSKSFWLPKSQVECFEEFSYDRVIWGKFEIPDWLAEEKGLDASLDGSLIE